MKTRKLETLPPTAPALLIAACRKRWKHYRSEHKRCREAFSNEAVHDLRIAARRMLALIQLLHAIAPRPRLRKLSRAFQKQLDEFGNLRDTQVMLAESSATLHELPHLQTFYKHLRDREAQLLRILRKTITMIDLCEVSKRLRKTRQSLAKVTDSALVAPILQAVDNAFLLTLRRYNWINPGQPATIHRTRIAFKAFRYMVEIIHPLLPDFPVEHLKQMANYQSLMGEIQDAEVFAHTLADFSAHASFPGFEAVRRSNERRHAEAISAYVTTMHHIHAFWRPTPTQPFPWEQTA